jgi:ribonuclease BN (tRNA processing enzyme)
MKLRVLGCSGGIGIHLRTTSMLIDRDILIDAGTGVGDLSLDELRAIDHVFLTHAHLDHIVSIPFMLDSVAEMRSEPLTVYATDATLAALQQHIFNWKIWPDFSQIPDSKNPCLRYQSITVGEKVCLDGRVIAALPADHVVPAVGYHLDSGQASFVYTGDTGTQDLLWECVNKIKNLKYLVIETAFPNDQIELAKLSKHLCPNLLAKELLKLKVNPEIYITHLKPGASELTMREITECVQKFAPKILRTDQVIEF